MHQAWLEALGLDQRAVQGETPPSWSLHPYFYYSQISSKSICWLICIWLLSFQTLIERLLCARHCSKHFICIISLASIPVLTQRRRLCYCSHFTDERLGRQTQRSGHWPMVYTLEGLHPDSRAHTHPRRSSCLTCSQDGLQTLVQPSLSNRNTTKTVSHDTQQRPTHIVGNL